MFYRYWILLACGMALFGCPAKQTATDAGPADSGPLDDGTQVRGDLVTRYVLPDGGVILATPDLSTETVFVFVDAADGGLEQRSALGNADGTFSIVVPAQRYTIQLGEIYLNTTTRTVHFGQNAAGRPDVYQAAINEGLSLTMSNVDAWKADDELQLASWGAGLDYFSSIQSSTILPANRPDAGDTSFAALAVNMEGSRVVDSFDAGDDFFITQLGAQPLDGGSWKTVTRVATPPVTLAIGKLTPLELAFSAVPQQPLSLRLDLGSFEASAGEVNPQAKAFESRALVDAHLGAFGLNTLTDGAPDLGILVLPADAGTVAFTLTYGNPYPSTWTPFVTVVTGFEALYRAPIADAGVLASARSEVASLARVMSLSEAQAGPISSLLGPVREVRVDGLSIGADAPTVSRAPLVSWSPPAVGTLTRVDIQAIQLTGAATGTRRAVGPILRVIGAATSVRLPEYFLEPGKTHYLRVTSVTQPSSWDPTTPLKDVGPPASSATMMTPAFLVAPLP
jgi:hypothetical protein